MRAGKPRDGKTVLGPGLIYEGENAVAERWSLFGRELYLVQNFLDGFLELLMFGVNVMSFSGSTNECLGDRTSGPGTSLSLQCVANSASAPTLAPVGGLAAPHPPVYWLPIPCRAHHSGRKPSQRFSRHGGIPFEPRDESFHHMIMAQCSGQLPCFHTTWQISRPW
ncbi:hypothetical protein BJY00DRAFT_192560 [Aspergillus carlsbadensis]|nr:hypothetical protein BJY00DRAFT_192560 [Aspergillus carlsbadensis]